MEKAEAFAAAIEALYARYPLQGGDSSPKKRAGVLKAETHRKKLLLNAKMNLYISNVHSTNALPTYARQAKIPVKQLLVLRALIYG